MAAVSNSRSVPIFELKSATLPLLALLLKTTDLQSLEAEFAERFGKDADLFDDDPVVLDLSPLDENAAPPEVSALIALARRYRLHLVAVRGGTEAQHAAARAAGLAEAPAAIAPPQQGKLPPVQTAAPTPAPTPAPVLQAQQAPQASAQAPAVQTTLIIDRPLRSGQQVYARGGDLVVMAAVNFGAEVMADGNIHVYAPLRGRAIAGALGNTGARIFSTCMEPQLISIAGTYRTTDTPLADNVLGKPAQVRLDGERLLIEPLER